MAISESGLALQYVLVPMRGRHRVYPDLVCIGRWRSYKYRAGDASGGTLTVSYTPPTLPKAYPLDYFLSLDVVTGWATDNLQIDFEIRTDEDTDSPAGHPGAEMYRWYIGVGSGNIVNYLPPLTNSFSVLGNGLFSVKKSLGSLSASVLRFCSANPTAAKYICFLAQGGMFMNEQSLIQSGFRV